ncbi:MAG: hypothetical protein OXI87_19505 [Albidovulum sp.]|nr:hypothetical protein [Albidovulum sp.]
MATDRRAAQLNLLELGSSRWKNRSVEQAPETEPDGGCARGCETRAYRSQTKIFLANAAWWELLGEV